MFAMSEPLRRQAGREFMHIVLHDGAAQQISLVKSIELILSIASFA
jgi:hypothetical protein